MDLALDILVVVVLYPILLDQAPISKKGCIVTGSGPVAPVEPVPDGPVAPVDPVPEGPVAPVDPNNGN